MKKQIPWHLIIAQLEQNITPGEKQQLTEWLSNDHKSGKTRRAA